MFFMAKFHDIFRMNHFLFSFGPIADILARLNSFQIPNYLFEHFFFLSLMLL